MSDDYAMDYEAFLATKALVAPSTGLTRDVPLGAHLFPFQCDVVRWALRKGRSCVFADCGMGKTAIALEWAHVVAAECDAPVMVVAPLAVAQQFVREGEKFGRPIMYVREPEDVGDARVVVTNYERLEKFPLAQYAGVVLDESSAIKAHDSRTRAFVVDAFRSTRFKLACTATPAPNDHMELGNHAEFMGVMTLSEMLSMFFVHDGGETQKWRLKGHAENAFWRWVCSWACMLRKPSDLGYPDGDFQLPPLRNHSHVVAADHSQAAMASGTLFMDEARTLQERRGARKASLDDRVAMCAAIVAAEPNEQWLIWCNLNAEGDALTKAIPGAVQVAGADTAEHKETALMGFAEGRVRVCVSKPSIAGWGMNFQSCARMAFVGLSDSFEELYQATRRCWRFGQTRPVDVHVITGELEGAVVANIERKEREALEMAEAMVGHMRETMRAEIRGTTRDVSEYRPVTRIVFPNWLRSEVA